jgi:hypothetical protein
VYLQHAAVAAIEPGQHDHFSADLETMHCRLHRPLQHEPRVRHPFVTLIRRGAQVDER